MLSIRWVFVFYTTCYFCDSIMSKVHYNRIAISGRINNKYTGLGLNEEERTTIIVGRYLQHNRDSTRHQYSPESVSYLLFLVLSVMIANPKKTTLD